MTLDGERVRMHDGNAERETKGGIQEETNTRARRNGTPEREDKDIVRTFHRLDGHVDNALVVDAIEAFVLALLSSKALARDP